MPRWRPRTSGPPVRSPRFGQAPYPALHRGHAGLSGAGQLFTYLYFLSEYTAPVVIGFALWRSGREPRWLAVLFTLGVEVAEAQSSKGPVVILFMLPWAVAMVVLAAGIWRSAGQPAARTLDPAPEPVSV
jgi:hypothetical protein